MSLPRSGSGISAPAGHAFRLPPVTAEQKVSEGLGWRLQLCVFLAAGLAIFSRRPDAFLNPQFFAEDGTFWFAQAYGFGWFHSLLHSQDGYFQTLPRVAASLALLVPLRFAPAVMNLVGITFQILPVNILLSSRCADWAPLPVRGVMSIAYIALPNTSELNVTVEEGQWHLALLACMLVLARTPKNVGWRIFDLSMILLFGVSGPFCLMLLPVAVLFCWQRRETWRVAVTAVLAAASAVQVSALLNTAAVLRTHGILGVTPALFVRLLGGQVFLGALLGQTSVPAHKPLLLLVLLALFGSAVICYTLLRARLELKLFVVFALLVFAASLRSPMVSNTSPQWQILSHVLGVRYWFFPMLAFVWPLIWFANAATNEVIRIGARCALIVMLVGVTRDWRYPRYPDQHFAEYARKFDNAAPGTLFAIPICPDGWFLGIVKKNPACPNLPIGFIDQPSHNARLSGSGVSTIDGWAAARQPIQRISIYLDRSLVESVKPTVFRPDLDARFPQSPNKQKGWTGSLQNASIPVGKHEIEIRAAEDNGCEADIGVIPIERVR